MHAAFPFAVSSPPPLEVRLICLLQRKPCEEKMAACMVATLFDFLWWWTWRREVVTGIE